jgi:uncharacterized protein YgfB (UPF0149 family)
MLVFLQKVKRIIKKDYSSISTIFFNPIPELNPIKTAIGELYMNLLQNDYCGDEAMAELLERAGSKLSLHEIYGLLHGIIAAPHMVMPSRITPLLFGDEGSEFRSMEDAKKLYANLMSLWNIIANWETDSEPFRYPEIKFPDTLEGLRRRVQDKASLIAHFLTGLAMGETDQNDFSEDAHKAFKSLSEANGLFLGYIGLLKMSEEGDLHSLEKSIALIKQLEVAAGNYIASINSGLKGARMRVVEDIRGAANVQTATYQTKHSKIPRNAPCPCGSGKKYKKCCGLTH